MTKLEMIDLLNKDLKNEWKHLRFYLYHATAVVGLHAEEFKELFLKEAASEMRHVEQFSSLIIGLGGVATHESNDFDRFTDAGDIMRYALAMEQEVVENYVKRMHDGNELGGTDGSWIEIFMEGQVQASREDVDHFRQIVRGL